MDAATWHCSFASTNPAHYPWSSSTAGPGGPGSAAELACGLSAFHAYEPSQRLSGGVPLTAAQHIEDLRDLVDSVNLPTPPAIVVHSWGAMLALVFAAEHPVLASSLALVGCGTFDERSRTLHQKTIDKRLTEAQRDRLTPVTGLPASRARLAEVRDLIDGVSTWDGAFPDADDQPIDFVAYATTCGICSGCRRKGYSHRRSGRSAPPF